jgi:4,5-DOPA dioxygenase extradiol
MFDPVFLSHGSPTLPFDDEPARDFLKALANGRERPKAILMVSAHWETQRPTVNAVAINDTIHDFFGFLPELYQLYYPAPGSAELAERVADLLAKAGIASDIDRQRGLDHGAWVPLMLAYPKTDIPVVQLSVQSHLGPGHHLEVGRALAPLREEGVWIMASGSYTHDLSSLRSYAGQPEPAWVSDFADWFDCALAEGRTSDLIAYRKLAPHAVRNHPTEEHLLPLYVALGAAGPNVKACKLHQSTTFGVLRMDAYSFSG